MSAFVECRTQAEADAAAARGDIIVWRAGHLVLRGSSRAYLHESSSATLHESSRAYLHESSSATLHDSSRADLYGSSRAYLYDSSSAVLYGSSRAYLYDSSSAVLHGSSSAYLYGSSRAYLYDSSRAYLYDSSRADLYDSSRADLYDSSHAFLYDSSRACLYDSSRADLYGSSRATDGATSAPLRRDRPRLILGPLGSRGDTLGVSLPSDGSEPIVYAGCWSGRLSAFAARVDEVYPTGRHGDEYLATIAYIRAIAAIPQDAT